MFKTGAYAKVWEVKPGNNGYVKARISTSKKVNDAYVTDFQSWVDIKDGSSIKEGDRIKIGDCAATNNYVKEKNITYYNFSIYSFEMADGNGASNTAKPKDDFKNIPDGIDEELPFC